MSEKGRLEALSAMIAAEIKGAPPKPKLQLVRREDLAGRICDHITRECRIDRIRWLARAYNLRWLIRQNTFGITGLDALEDNQIEQLHRDMERARECMVDGVSFEDAGLVHSNCHEGAQYEMQNENTYF